MKKHILVYDVRKRIFRELDINNYNDDYTIGAIIFDRKAVDVLEQYYHICGCVLIGNKDKQLIPIDIHDKEIVMLEGSYNCLNKKLREELLAFNLHTVPSVLWSQFFIKWQFLGVQDIFRNSGSFFELCENIMGNELMINALLKQKRSIIFPTTYEELCGFTQLLVECFDIDFYNAEYTAEFNYVLDSLIHNYHMKMKTFDVIKYCYQICNVANRLLQGEM